MISMLQVADVVADLVLRRFWGCPGCGHDCDLIFGPIFTKFGTQPSLNIPKKDFGQAQNGRGQGHVTKSAILHPFNYFCTSGS